MEEPAGFGDLQIERELGRGAFGTVYLAYDPLVGRQVALKVVRARDTSAVGILKEGRLPGALAHPNIVTLHRVHPPEEGDLWGFEFEYIEGGTLADQLCANGPVAPRHALELARGIAAGLAAAHERGVVHGDVKPGNVLMARDGTPKLADFGLGRLLGDVSLHASQSGGGAGTPTFMAPEVLMGERTTPASDVWSLGVVMHRLVSGRLPFGGNNLHDLMYAIQQLPPPAPPTDTPAPLQAAIYACLAKRSEERPRDAGKVLAILRDEARAAAPEPARAAPLGAPLLRGRGAELEALGARVDRAIRGDGGCVLLVGAEGVGKSAIVSEAARRGRSRGMIWLSARVSGLEGIVRPMLRALQLATRDEAELGARYESSRETISRVLETSPELRIDTSQPALAVLERTLREMAHDATVGLAIEDVHEGSAEDVALVAQLTRLLLDAGALVLITARDIAGAANPVHGLAAHAFVERQNIEPLSAEDAYALLDDHAAAQVDAAVARRIHEHAHGNPRFTLELFRFMLARGAVRRENGAVVPGPAWDAAELPYRFHELVVNQLEDLAPDDRELLDHAAVAGPRFDGEDVAAITGRPLLKVLRTMQTLYREHGLITPTRAGFRFASPIVRTVLYRDLAAPLRRELHRAFAEHLGTRDEADPELLAEHWDRAGEPELARPLLRQAALQAALRLEVHRAIELAARGGIRPETLDGETAVGNAKLILSIIGKVADLGRKDEAESMAEVLMQAARERGDDPLRLRALVRRERWRYEAGGEKAVDRGALEQAARTLFPCIELIEARYLLGLMCKFRGELDAAEAHLEDAMKALTAYPQDGYRARVLHELASVALRHGHAEEADALYQESAAIDERLGRLKASAVTSVNRVVAGLRFGRLRNAVPDLERAIQRLKLEGAVQWACHARLVLADVQYALGSRDAAESSVESALGPLEEHSYFLGLGYGRILQGMLLMVRGLAGDALPILTEVEEHARERGHLQYRSFALAWRATACCALGRFDDAERDARACAGLVADTDDESLRRDVAGVLATTELMGLDTAPLGLAALVEGAEGSFEVALVEAARQWRGKDATRLRAAAEALRAAPLGVRRLELETWAGLIEAEASRRAHDEAGARRIAAATLEGAHRLGHAWLIQALGEY